MKISPLLSNVRHRAMRTPVSRLLTRLIHISPELLDSLSFVWNYSRNGSCPLDWTSNQCSIQIHCFKKPSIRYAVTPLVTTAMFL